MRGKPAKKREVKPDGLYNSVLVTRLVNAVMQDGKKEVARGIVYNMIEDFGNKTKTKGVEGIEKALDNVKPRIEVKSRRVGGANFQVPVQVNEHRQLSLALRWIIDAARASRKTDEFYKSLSRELVNAYNKEGVAFKKKEEVFRMAEANKAFAQFA